MKLSQLNKGQWAVIKEIDLPADLKQRFQSMGLYKDVLIYVCRVGFLRGSFNVKTSCDSCIIISKNEAEHIKVQLAKKEERYKWGKKEFVENCQTCCQND